MTEYKNPAATSTVIVEVNDKYLLVKRKDNPFKGKWAFPGGYLNCDKETLERAAQRELQEETQLRVKQKNLYLLCVRSEPDRDPRGHVIDHVYVAKNVEGIVRASDDAADYKWATANEIKTLAFDHYKDFKLYLRQKELGRI